jgi:hypothetical protein
VNRSTTVAVFAMLCAMPQLASAQSETAAFIIRIGTDTLGVERYVRSADRIVIDAVQRSPATTIHQLVMTLGAAGSITAAEWTSRSPGSEQPATRREFRFVGDSAVVTTTQGTTSRTQSIAARGAVPLSGPFYTPYELLMMRARAAGTPRSELTLLSGTNPVTIPVERIGADSMALQNQFGEPLRAHVDDRGRLLHLRTPALTTVERVAELDFERLAREFARRDDIGRGMGMLSVPRTFRTRVGQANLWLDYSRPAMRGRPVWGTLVPWNQVWRLGANDATHFSTDRPLDIGGLALEPGTYTLFLLPSEAGWSLIVSRATGIGGLAYDPAHDVGRITLTVEPLENRVELLTIDVTGGTEPRLVVAWDRLRGSAPIRVR